MAEAQAHAVVGIPAHTALQLISQETFTGSRYGAVRVVIARRPTYFPWVFWSPNDRDGTVCTNAKPP